VIRPVVSELSAQSLLANDLIKSYGARRVLDGVSLTASPGQRLGLVGENGAGKSTLLRLLAGLEQPDAGEVTRPADIGLLHQEPPFAGADPVGAVVEAALAEVRGAERRLADLAEALRHRPDDAALLARYGDALAEVEATEAWDADHRAERVLDGLGLARIERSRPVVTLSGGERSRLALAALLLRQPRALLLDEPTNHLDDEAIGFVEEHLRRLPGVVVAASHDRVFLDAVCTAICDLDPTRGDPTRGDPTRGGITRYGGAYTDYLTAKRAERARWERQYRDEQDELAGLRQAVAVTARQVAHNRPWPDGDKAAYNGHGELVQRAVSARVRNARRRLDELDRRQVRKPPAPLRFTARVVTTGAPGEGPVVSLRRVRVPGRLAIDHLDLAADDRLLVTGGNGAGKSTLLAVLAGRLAPAAGTAHRRRGVRVGLLEQDVAFTRPDRPAVEVYAAALAGRPAPPELAELGLIAPRDLGRPVGQLSVGQRRRLALAVLIAATPHVLALDEPTNHLSLSLVEELEEALAAAPGAIVAASHDRWLRRRWSGREIALAAGQPVLAVAG
jgi:macrolide transport system ATP-binding/permease protein